MLQIEQQVPFSTFKEFSIQVVKFHFVCFFFCHFATKSVIFCLETDEEKLRWTFRLYDMDNNGVIDMEEMIGIIETLDSIEGVKPGARTKRWQIKCLKG